MKIIFLIDMDYFFAACEELRNPKFKEKPIAVVTDTNREGSKGVIMTCNYEARKYGIKSGMPAAQGLALNPKLILIKEDFKYYEQNSSEVMAIIKSYSNKVEQVSIDEAFLDVSEFAASYAAAEDLARKLKLEINTRLGLPCSIGISSNKLVAKMACDAAKPDGIKLVKQEEAKAFLSKLPVGKLYGIGTKTKEKLEAMNIKTVGELASSNKMSLMQHLGNSMGLEIYNYANGVDESDVVTEYETKSIGRERTLKKDTTDENEVIPVITELSKEVLLEAKKEEYLFKVVTVKMRYLDFSDHLKSKTIKSSNNLEDLQKTAIELFKKYVNKEKPLRKVGVRISGLTKGTKQKGLGLFMN